MEENANPENKNITLQIRDKRRKRNFIILISALLIILSLILILIPLIARINQENKLEDKQNYKDNDTKPLNPNEPGQKPTYDANGKVIIDIPAKDVTQNQPYGPNAGGIQNLNDSIPNPTTGDLLHGINNSKFLDANGNVLSAETIKTNPTAITYFDSNGNGKLDIGIDYTLKSNETSFMNHVASNLDSTFSTSSIPISDFTIYANNKNTSVSDLLNTGLLKQEDITSSTVFKLDGIDLSGSYKESPSSILKNEISNTNYQNFSTTMDKYYNDLLKYNTYQNTLTNPLTKDEINNLDDKIRSNSNNNTSLMDEKINTIINKNSSELTKKINDNAINGLNSAKNSLTTTKALFDDSGMSSSSTSTTAEITNIDNLKTSLNNSITTGAASTVTTSSEIFDKSLLDSLSKNSQQSYEFNKNYLNSNADISNLNYPTELIDSKIYDNLPKNSFNTTSSPIGDYDPAKTNSQITSEIINYLKDNKMTYSQNNIYLNEKAPMDTEVLSTTKSISV